VVAAHGSSLPEVGGEAALYVGEPGDAAELAGALQTAIGDTKVRARLKKAALARAAGFTWDRCAAGVAEVVRELV
jgi:alpha-1,3-rhamnosyl/mannosyltransferase